MFGEINVIRKLATEYSKPQLARMVQMGEIEPQKAVLAGMMIDRIAKSAMQPPQTTVAEDVLGAAPTAAQGQIPQGVMGAPQAPPASAGVSSLPSGIRDMAGGGIVAFADGGDVPGYAEGTLTNSRYDPAMRINPAVQAKRDITRYEILAQELKDAQRRMMKGDPRAKADFEALQREMRSIKPAPRADTGIGELIPSAQAATPMATKVNAQAAPEAEEEGAYDPMTGLRITGPEAKPYNPELKPGTVYEPNPIRDILQGGPGKPKAEEAKPVAPAAPVAPKPPVRMDVPPTEEAPRGEAAEEKIKPPAQIEAEQIPVPEETSFGKEYGDIQSAYKQAGVDTDMYKNMMQELEGKKAGFAQKKEQALGAALMSFGLGFARARVGEVYEQLSGEGQKALGMYMNNMDKITENEEKIDSLKSQLRMAENNFKRTGADSALTQMRARKDRIEQIQTKNAELKQRAAEHQATVGASVYHTDVAAQTQREVAGAQVAGRVAAAQASAGRAGMLTDKQKFDIKQQIQATLEPKLREQYKNNPNAERIIQQKLNEAFLKEIESLRATPSGYGGAPQEKDMFADWSVEGM